ncbi:hypothetical protein [Streptomyces apricus]|uniref:Secreted protein n=1 Tax=Streptomyces apricus TaxID=1828112 RepID=A0A5A9ZVR5_9ACTN|nr:hypothetical protein [Streptomyces apricus]KAA0921548.1 hypothetical protein FGF04_36305 [Streptomyces apricus]
MAESPHTAPPADGLVRRSLPAPALCGFLLLLALVFSLSYAVGSVSGPVAPGMHGTGGTGTGGGQQDGGSGDGTDDMPGMHGSGE